MDREELDRIVRIIFDEVRRKGDEAISKYTYHYDGVTVDAIQVTQQELDAAVMEMKAEEEQEAVLTAEES